MHPNCFYWCCVHCYIPIIVNLVSSCYNSCAVRFWHFRVDGYYISRVRHRCGDHITNSLAEEAKGGRVKLLTMGWKFACFTSFLVFCTPFIIYIYRACLSCVFSLIRGREECPQHKYNKGHIKISIPKVRHSVHFEVRRIFFKVNYGAWVDTC